MSLWWLDLSFFLLYMQCCCLLPMPMSFIISQKIDHPLKKTPRELMERFIHLTHQQLPLFDQFMHFSFLHTALFSRLDSKPPVRSRTYIIRHLDCIRKARSGQWLSPELYNNYWRTQKTIDIHQHRVKTYQ